MTTRVRIEVLNGNKQVSVVDQSGYSHATLEDAGRSVEVDLYDGMQLMVQEVGDFNQTGNSSLGGEPGSNVPDERIQDGGSA